MAKRNRIIDADKVLEESGFKMPGREVLRLQKEQLAAEASWFKRFTQFGPLASMVKSLKK